MNTNEPPFNPAQAAALKQLRLRWGIALLTNLPLPFIALPIAGSDWINQEPGGAAAQSMGFTIAIGLIALGAGHVLRIQAYKADWKADAIGPGGYVRGNSHFFAVLTAGALAIFTLSVGGAWPAPIFAAAPVLIGLLIFNFPNGKPMRPAPPRLLDGEEL